MTQTLTGSIGKTEGEAFVFIPNEKDKTPVCARSLHLFVFHLVTSAKKHVKFVDLEDDEVLLDGVLVKARKLLPVELKSVQREVEVAQSSLR